MKPNKTHFFRLSLAAALVLLSGGWYLLNAQQARALASRVTGLVQVQKGGAGPWRPLTANAQLADSDVIRTGPQSAVLLTTRTGQVRLGEKTEAALTSILSGPQARIEVRRGFSWFSVNPGSVQRFEVRTPTTVAAVRGTKFAVATDDAGVISCVCEGKIETASTAAPQNLAIAEQGDSNDYAANGAYSQRDLSQYFRGLKVDTSFRAVVQEDAKFRSCMNCHRMTNLATDNSPDPGEY
jgi:hypothetical protein